MSTVLLDAACTKVCDLSKQLWCGRFGAVCGAGWAQETHLWGSVAQAVAHGGAPSGASVGPGSQAQQLPVLLLIEPSKLHRLQVAVYHSVDVQAVHCTQNVVQCRHLHQHMQFSNHVLHTEQESLR